MLARTREQLEGTFDTAPSWIDESLLMPDNVMPPAAPIVITFLTRRALDAIFRIGRNYFGDSARARVHTYTYMYTVAAR